jgi:radical SAM protein with 4Fe4S-binding SPASM domain
LKEESKKDCELEKGVFGLEITTTQACNFRCTYCFERNHEPEEQLLDAKIVIKRIKQLLDTEWFNEQYSGIKLILWGGEPTMNMPLCKSLMEAFRQNERICFFVYTNGSIIDNFMPTLRRLKNQKFVKKGLSKVTIQVSYDGNPIHDMRRIDSNGQGTSLIARNAIAELQKYGIDYGLKATITWKDYHILPDAWEDINGLHKIIGKKVKYALTVDYYNVQFRAYKEDIEEALIKVAQKEIKFYQEFKYFLSNIFRSNKAFCATGKSMAVVDTNGDVFYCHGSIYSKCSEEFKYTNIFSKNFINSIEKANKFFYINHIEPEECKQCIAISCLRCNVKKYEESKGETFKDRWYDYPAQKDLCEYYKMVGKVGAAMGSFLNRSKK